MKGIRPWSPVLSRIIISCFGLKKRDGEQKKKKVLLTNKKLFIQPGL